MLPATAFIAVAGVRLLQNQCVSIGFKSFGLSLDVLRATASIAGCWGACASRNVVLHPLDLRGGHKVELATKSSRLFTPLYPT